MRNESLSECLVYAEIDSKQNRDTFDDQPEDAQLPSCVPSKAPFLFCALTLHDLSAFKFPSCVIRLLIIDYQSPVYVHGLHALSIGL